MRNLAPLIDECCLCLGTHNIKDCVLLKSPTVINDQCVTVKAYATLPSVLSIEMTCEGKETVKAESFLCRGTRFGPLNSQTISHDPLESDFYLRIILSTNQFEYLNLEDKTLCNWMCLVQPATCFQDCNMVAYQSDFKIYFSVLKDIKAHSILKVYYSPYYAEKLGVEFIRSNELDNIGNYTDYDEVMFNDNEPLGPNDYMEGINEMEEESSHFVSPEDDFDPQSSISNSTLDMSKLSNKSLGAPKDKREWTCSICSNAFHSIPDFAKHLHKHYVTDNKEVTKTPAVKSNKNVVPNSFMLLSEPMTVPPTLNNLTLTVPTLNLGDEIQMISDLNMTYMNPSVPILYMESIPRTLDQTKANLPPRQVMKCDICDKKFGNVKNIKRHLKKHSVEHICAKCGKIFARKETLLMHECVDLLYRCKQCPAVFTRVKVFREHKAKHLKLTGKYQLSSLTCMFCPLEYDTILSFIEHLRSHYSKTLIMENIDCPICKQKYNRLKVFFRTHLKMHENNVYCNQCKGVFASVCSYNKHSCFNPVDIDADLQKEITPKTKMYRAANLPRPGPVTRALYTCDICLAHFNDKESFTLHKKNHATHPLGIVPVLCNHCGKSYNSTTVLRKHIARIHSDKIKCSESSCEKQFNTEDELILHIQLHKNKQSQPSFVCTYCSKEFKCHRYRTRHIKIKHCTDARYECHICNKKFKDKSYLNSHLKFKHSDQPRVRVCNYTYSCHLCKRLFTKKSVLRRHIVTHSKKISYACSFCPKVMVRAKRMESHLQAAHADKKLLWNNREFFNTLKVVMDMSEDNLVNKENENVLEDENEVDPNDKEQLQYQDEDGEMGEFAMNGYQNVNNPNLEAEYQIVSEQIPNIDVTHMPNLQEIPYPTQDSHNYPMHLNMEQVDNLLSDDPIKLFDLNSELPKMFDSNSSTGKQARELPVDSINNFDLSVFYNEPSVEMTNPVTSETQDNNTVDVSVSGSSISHLPLSYNLPAVSTNPQLVITDSLPLQTKGYQTSISPLHTIQASDIQIPISLYNTLPVYDGRESQTSQNEARNDNLLYVVMDPTKHWNQCS